MPVRSLNSPVLVWPNRARIDDALHKWAAQVAAERPELLRLGYFGSYARGDWGVGSDLDLVALVASAVDRFDRRSLAWNITSLPVPAEILIYTESEWRDLERKRGRFAEMLARDTVWVFSRT
jgi:predicted nucleotidyltransferase